jgi:hydroxyacylglutathione hydrolase
MDNRSLLVVDDASRRGVIVDPSFEPEPLSRAIAEHGVEPVAVLLTHGHIDHIAGLPLLSEAAGLPVWVHSGDAPMLTDPILNGSFLFGVEWVPVEPARLLEDGESIGVGDLTLRILHTPGHSPGGITIDVNGGEALIAGDLLFRGGVGRTDLPGGDQATMVQSLRRVLEEFDDPPVHPGHGEATTLAHERATNPFLQMWSIV